jgi:hypothetical protein
MRIFFMHRLIKGMNWKRFKMKQFLPMRSINLGACLEELMRSNIKILNQDTQCPS